VNVDSKASTSRSVPKSRPSSVERSSRVIRTGRLSCRSIGLSCPSVRPGYTTPPGLKSDPHAFCLICLSARSGNRRIRHAISKICAEIFHT
jgi:hypothetical protein